MACKVLAVESKTKKKDYSLWLRASSPIRSLLVRSRRKASKEAEGSSGINKEGAGQKLVQNQGRTYSPAFETSYEIIDMGEEAIHLDVNSNQVTGSKATTKGAGSSSCAVQHTPQLSNIMDTFFFTSLVIHFEKGDATSTVILNGNDGAKQGDFVIPSLISSLSVFVMAGGQLCEVSSKRKRWKRLAREGRVFDMRIASLSSGGKLVGIEKEVFDRVVSKKIEGCLGFKLYD
ncbi:hypothetical protein ACOSP7_016701 [Xanthoceras sorbifolium]